MSRRKTETKPSDSPEKQSKASRNPLRRGTSSKNMQQIPSPNASINDLQTLSPDRLNTPVRPKSSQSRPSHSSQPPPGSQSSQADEDATESSLTKHSLINGNDERHDRRQDPKARPPSTIKEEVWHWIHHVNSYAEYITEGKRFGGLQPSTFSDRRYIPRSTRSH